MTLRTPLCEQLGIELPIVQAPIGPAALPELAAAVSNAGGLGMLSITWKPPSMISDEVRRTLALTTKAFGVNAILEFPSPEAIDAALELGVQVVSTFWGDPGLVHARIASAGAIHMHTVQSPEDARRAVDAGVDVVVAQGWEAGGHVLGEIATLPLVPAVVDAVDPVPVIAAGGIADGRGLAAALMLGAQAAWLGTRFVAATEAGSHGDYRERLVAAAAGDAVHTTCFNGGWPNAPHRVLRNRTLDAWEAAGQPAEPDRPGEGAAVASYDSGEPLPRYHAQMPLAEISGELSELANYAGQSVGLVHDVQPAADIIAAIAAQAEETLHRINDRGIATEARSTAPGPGAT
jgi:nitronate monooxygenase/enoyl-[acyl-carrier protein] reductase II